MAIFVIVENVMFVKAALLCVYSSWCDREECVWVLSWGVLLCVTGQWGQEEQAP